MNPVQRTAFRSPIDQGRVQHQLDALRDASEQVEVVVRRPADLLWCRAAVVGPGFVASCTLVDETDRSALTVVASGPLEQLVETLWELVPAAADTDRPLGWGHELVAVEDVALLADVVRHHDIASLDVALDVTGHPAMPEWVREAAYGIDAVLTVGLVSGVTDVTTCRAHLMPSGWFAMSLDADGLTRAEPLAHADLRRALLNACTSLAIASATRVAA